LSPLIRVLFTAILSTKLYKIMAHHQSAKKRIRQNEQRKQVNKYFVKTMRNALKKLKNTKNKKEASELYPKVTSMLDKLARKNVIHKNKSSNIKSKLAKLVNSK
jgi:small subunit ribosomal protein S20